MRFGIDSVIFGVGFGVSFFRATFMRFDIDFGIILDRFWCDIGVMLVSQASLGGSGAPLDPRSRQDFKKAVHGPLGDPLVRGLNDIFVIFFFVNNMILRVISLTFFVVRLAAKSVPKVVILRDLLGNCWAFWGGDIHL